MRTFLSVGECMVEFSGGDGGAWRLGFAGDTLNTAWCVRALLDREAWRVGHLTRVGTDAFSDRMLAFYADAGLWTDPVSRDPERRPGLYVIERHDGERSFTYWRGESAARGLADDEAALRRAVETADALHVSGITLAILTPDRREALLDLLRRARRRGAVTAFDTNLRPALWETPEAMRSWTERAATAAAIALPSFDDEAAAFGDADPAATAERYLRAGVEEVVVKDASRPALCVHPGGRAEIAPGAEVRVVDTTGAGDAFGGTYLAARLMGEPPPDAVRRAHSVAARVVGVVGALAPMDAIRDAARAPNRDQ